MQLARDLDLEKLFLAHGSHNAPDEGMCIMEAVAFVAGEPHSDEPKCASPLIANFLRRWNDTLSDEDRQILKPLIPKLVGTRGSDALEQRRAWMLDDWMCRTQLPAWLELAKHTEEASALRALPEIVDLATLMQASPIIQAAQKKTAAAWAAARDAAWAAAWAAARDAAWAAAWAAARDAARDAAWRSAVALVERMIAANEVSGG